MAAQPRDDDVISLIAMTEGAVDHQEAIARLKGNNNNLAQALNEYFDNPDNTRYRWDESQFSCGRQGEANHGISFNVQGADDPGPSGYFDGTIGAPSRPPSRSSQNKSPLHNNVIDMSSAHAAADPRNSMTRNEQDDEGFQQAMAASRADVGLPPQESGVMGTNEVYFGPANRSQYEQGKWDLVPMGGASAQEILLDPDPAERKREVDVPAFLKPSIADHRLGALLTIYHEIPIAWETFMDRLNILPDYGYDPEWWTGKAIEISIVTAEDGHNFDRSDDKFCHELQRLMAFLDKTDRSYGSVEVLTNLRIMKRFQRRELDTEAAFFEIWRTIWEGTEEAKRLFSRGVPSDEDGEEEGQNFAILDLVQTAESTGIETIYDVADKILWPQPTLDISKAAYLSHIGDVIAFRLKGSESSKGIEIPAVWYPDRYLKSGREAALKMRQQQAEIEEELERLVAIEKKLTYYSIPGGKVVKVQDLLESSLQHDVAKIENDVKLAHGFGDDDVQMPEQRVGKGIDLSAEIRKAMESIDKKLTELNEEKEKARTTLRQLSKLYTGSSHDPEQPALHPYTLRGLSTTKTTTYICRRSEPDLIVMDLEEQQATKDQWWRINYATTGSNPIIVEKTTQEKVLEAAVNESKNPIVVYASEKAMNWPRNALPHALEQFVRTDNLQFSDEFSASEESQSRVASPKSPGKRKYDDTTEEEEERPRLIGREDSVQMAESHLGGSDGADWRSRRALFRPLTSRIPDRSVTPKQNEGHEVIIGVDPFQIIENDGHDGHDEHQFVGQEMQERSSLPILSSHAKDTQQSITMDSMDVDEVMQDADVREESVAVKHVGFSN